MLNKQSSMVLLTGLFFLAGCLGPTITRRDPPESPPPDPVAPTVLSLEPASGGALLPSSEILIVFSKSMAPASLGITGTGAAGVTVAWSTETSTNDKLTLTGFAASGASLSLVINAESTQGLELEQQSLSYHFYGEDSVYVCDTGGDDADPGTVDAPKKTLLAGLTARATVGAAETRVCQGTYSVESAVITGILRGGYDASDLPASWANARDLTENATVIESTLTEGGTTQSPSATIVMGSSSWLEGFTVRAPTAGVHTAAIRMITLASAEVSDCFVNGGGGTQSATGIYARNIFASCSIHDNTISVDTGTLARFGIRGEEVAALVKDNTITVTGGGSTSTGVFYEDSTTHSSGTIEANTVTAGTGTWSYGLRLSNYKGEVLDNSLNGGAGTSSFGLHITQNSTSGMPRYQVARNTVYGGTGNNSVGMRLHSVGMDTVEPRVWGNRVHGGAGVSSSIGVHNGYSLVHLYNNLIFGGSGPDSRGVEIDAQGGHPRVRNNTVSAGSGADSAYALYSNGASQGIYENNILTVEHSAGTTRYCASFHGDVNSMKNNVFKSCGDGVYETQSDPAFSYIVLVDGGGGLNNGPFASDNYTHAKEGDEEVDATPFTFVDGASAPNADWNNVNWRPDVTSDPAILAGGIDGDAEGFGFTADITETLRTGDGTVGWTLGAYEVDL